MVKLIKIIVALALVLSSCNKDEGIVIRPDPPTVDFVDNIETDKSRYNPSDVVSINLQLKNTAFDKIRIRYKYLTALLSEEMFMPSNTSFTLNWSPPTDDFKGYSVEFEFIKDGEIVDYASTAVDVSSDWTKFPRYGKLSKFSDLPSSTIESNIKKLNAFHINGLQFYDWHNKHHIPLKMNGSTPASSWMDIARRNTSFNTVNGYIQAANSRNIATMSYNLLYGAWEDYASDGVSEEWLVYNDPNRQSINKHEIWMTIGL